MVRKVSNAKPRVENWYMTAAINILFNTIQHDCPCVGTKTQIVSNFALSHAPMSACVEDKGKQQTTLVTIWSCGFTHIFTLLCENTSVCNVLSTGMEWSSWSCFRGHLSCFYGGLFAIQLGQICFKSKQDLATDFSDLCFKSTGGEFLMQNTTWGLNLLIWSLCCKKPGGL